MLFHALKSNALRRPVILNISLTRIATKANKRIHPKVFILGMYIPPDISLYDKNVSLDLRFCSKVAENYIRIGG